MRDERATAIAAAQAGAAIVRDGANQAGAVRSKTSATDLVTEVDIASGVAIVRLLLEVDPSACIVVEEDEVYEITGVSPGDPLGPEVWVIDPVDGTTSFVHNFPAYSVSVALLRNGRPVAGAVVDVPHGVTMSAAEGLGAHLEGVPVRCGEASRLDEALLITGFPYDREAALDRQLAVLAAFLRSPVHGIRRDGSAALDCCHVAADRADGFWEYGLQPWDTAAGTVICREAGALVTDIDGADWSPARNAGIVVANPVLHGQMLEVIRRTTGRAPEQGASDA